MKRGDLSGPTSLVENAEEEGDITDSGNLKNKTNEHNRNRITDTENKQVVARGKGSWWRGGKNG